jgi:hypothetical protein
MKSDKERASQISETHTLVHFSKSWVNCIRQKVKRLRESSIKVAIIMCFRSKEYFTGCRFDFCMLPDADIEVSDWKIALLIDRSEAASTTNIETQ